MNRKICIIGLGYVGLPLAVALAKKFHVTGFDIHHKRILELQTGHDRTNEISLDELNSVDICFTNNIDNIKDCSIYIITVPTPLESGKNEPDLNPLKSACRTVSDVIKKNDIVVIESTVYPGVTENVCGSLLEELTTLKQGVDFFMGYSPERINPGDKIHTIEKITKVISAQTKETVEILETIYGGITEGNIFIAKDIKTAEAAKVIENTQRDINIAFINEITKILHKANISIYDVLKAARTKWNFLNFSPGLVGGHCIGIDPYYLAYFSKQEGALHAMVLSGREVNESMPDYITHLLHSKLQSKKNTKGKILILGVTFKENIPDTRNSKACNVCQNLVELGYDVTIYDPYVNTKDIYDEYGLTLIKSLKNLPEQNAILCLVPHDEFRSWTLRDFINCIEPHGLIFDIKNIWSHIAFPTDLEYFTL